MQTNELFQKQKFITSDKELIELLKTCPKCYKTINYGEFILSYDELKNIKFNSKTPQKICLILNTNSSTQPFELLGHWLLLLIDLNIKHCLIYDSLDSIQENYPKVLKVVKTFCNVHNLSYNIVHGLSQQQKSLVCGYIAAYFIHIFHDTSLDKIKKVCAFFQQNSTNR